MIAVQGLAQVKIAKDEAVALGQRLKASDVAGEARGLRDGKKQGLRSTEDTRVFRAPAHPKEDNHATPAVALLVGRNPDRRSHPTGYGVPSGRALHAWRDLQLCV
jgi:hypothetical protein